jgi:sulfur carrier protein ThiS
MAARTAEGSPPRPEAGGPAGEGGPLEYWEVEVVPGRPVGAPIQRLRVRAGSTVTDVLSLLGCPLEGSAVLLDGRPVPLDAPLPGACRLEVIPTFSGG